MFEITRTYTFGHRQCISDVFALAWGGNHSISLCCLCMQMKDVYICMGLSLLWTSPHPAEIERLREKPWVVCRENEAKKTHTHTWQLQSSILIVFLCKFTVEIASIFFFVATKHGEETEQDGPTSADSSPKSHEVWRKGIRQMVSEIH